MYPVLRLPFCRKSFIWGFVTHEAFRPFTLSWDTSRFYTYTDFLIDSPNLHQVCGISNATTTLSYNHTIMLHTHTTPERRWTDDFLCIHPVFLSSVFFPQICRPSLFFLADVAIKISYPSGHSIRLLSNSGSQKTIPNALEESKCFSGGPRRFR